MPRLPSPLLAGCCLLACVLFLSVPVRAMVLQPGAAELGIQDRPDGGFVMGDEKSGPVMTLSPEGDRYGGGMLDGKPHGKGVLRKADGERYEGEFQAGLYHGNGSLRMANGTVYSGEFAEGLFHGKGKLQDMNEWNSPDLELRGTFSKGQPHGEMLVVTQDGAFRAQYIMGKQGRVIEQLKDGLFFDGPRDKAGKAQGQGVQEDLSSGCTWTGVFQQGQLQGKGEMRCPDGQFYKGDFVNGRYQGQGEQYESWSSCTYTGGFHDGQKHGQGVTACRNGYRHTGKYVDGNADGPGEAILPNGGTFKGAFKYDQAEGKGVLVFADGSRFEGGFEGWQPMGPGVFIDAAGKRHQGTFGVNWDNDGLASVTTVTKDGKPFPPMDRHYH